MNQRKPNARAGAQGKAGCAPCGLFGVMVQSSAIHPASCFPPSKGSQPHLVLAHRTNPVVVSAGRWQVGQKASKLRPCACPGGTRIHDKCVPLPRAHP